MLDCEARAYPAVIGGNRVLAGDFQSHVQRRLPISREPARRHSNSVTNPFSVWVKVTPPPWGMMDRVLVSVTVAVMVIPAPRLTWGGFTLTVVWVAIRSDPLPELKILLVQ